MARLYSVPIIDMVAGHRAGNPESGMNPVNDHREIFHSPEIPDAVRIALRNLLQTGRRSLLGRLHGMVMSGGPAGGWQGIDDGFADDAAAGEAAMIRVISINRELQQIEDALQRIGKDGFGHCVYCRGVIEPARLEGRPTVRSCQRCQDRLRLPALAPGVQ
jgi:RNA polymerase-binding transcription factor DksA